MGSPWNEYEARDIRPAKSGWAPGGYVRPCLSCGKEFIGEKRSYQCAQCAYAKTTQEPPCNE